MKKIAVALCVVASLTACADMATPFQPLGTANEVVGGYTDEQLAPDRFSVVFSGNSLTSRQTVEDYLLFRAAQLTIEMGCEWFVIVRRDTTHSVMTMIDPGNWYRPDGNDRPVHWMPSWRYQLQGQRWKDWDPDAGEPFWADGLSQRTIESFEVRAEIRFGTGTPEDPGAIVASQIVSEVGPRVVYPRGSKSP